VLGPPQGEGPVVIRAGFHLHDVNAIDDDSETFEFTGVLTFKWRDARQAFDPAEAGVNEKVFQGNFQFNEIAPSWFPQEILLNECGMYAKNGVVLRSRSDGTQILVQMVNAIAKAEFTMRRFPFDVHRLEAVFAIPGFDREEVVFQADPDSPVPSIDSVRIPQWTIAGISVASREAPGACVGCRGAASTFVVCVEVKRKSFFIIRLIMLPLALIVVLSFSVFWMDRSSLGDRISVSFIGILTAVAYQFLVTDILPRIAYVTFIHAFLSFSFLTMCATVVVNLLVGACDKKGMHEVGHRIDRRCRWVFPIVYFGLIGMAAGIVAVYY
jgi:hypothetical protein